ncbi:MAG: hypothetical protein ACRERE_00220 [Candidatus Entotheonellia bacterium]
MDDRIFSKIISGSDIPGLGSTRWFGYKKKTVVEACLPLDIAVLAREMHFSAGCDVKGVFTWTEPETESIRVSSGFVAKTTGGEGWLRLSYELTPTKDAVECSIVLTTTTPNFGGVRWWAWCPFIGSSERCLQRVRCLYLPPGAREFACRGCHNLTYRSCQEGHKYDRSTHALLARLWGINPQELPRRLQRKREGVYEN